MELTIEQALQQGVIAHKAGKLQDAERFYRAILQSKPLHPDANHNLGVLAVSVNKTGAALPLFKKALEANPKIEQFWLSYIDVLTKEKQFDTAKRVLEQAKKQGFDKDRLNNLEAQFSSKSQRPNTARISPPKELLNSLLAYYQNGRFSDAEKVAIHIIQEFPKHQFAWKVLGAVLGATGRKSEAVDANQTAVDLSPQDAAAHMNLGITLSDLGRLDEAEVSYKQAIALKPDYAEAHSNLGVTLNDLGRLDEAEDSYKQAIALKPDYTEAHSNLGVTLKNLGRLDEALASYNQATAIKPDFAEPHSNLGNTLKELGRFEEAEASYARAIALKSDFAEAHHNLGITQKAMGSLDEAEASFRQAIASKPDYAEAHNNLGSTLQEIGRLDEALASFTQAIALKSDFSEAYANLSVLIKNVRFNSSNRKLYPSLTKLLNTGNFTRPSDVAHSILSLLKHDPLIKNFLLEENFPSNLKEATSVIGSLDELTLLHHLMRVCPLPDLQFEEFFVNMRSLLLLSLDNIEASAELIKFLSTLSLHCFTNEYIYVERGEETELIEKLVIQIKNAISKSEQPEATRILCLATYRPIHQYPWCKKLNALDHLEEVRKRLIKEPLAEEVIASDIAALGEISDSVSRKVREQYEENPYPRWVKLAIPIKAKLISEVCDDANLLLHCESIKNVTAPAILVAGCGTGQHSIGTASRFAGCQVTAVDLSLASLAYAKRKTIELNITNLEYFQADILALDELQQQFDIIESAGVLHHMDEPMAGWRVLVDLLKPGGLMKIGLYSEFARQHIVEVREGITLRNAIVSETDIREFRQSLADPNDETYQFITRSIDFFSLSTLRDLIFHVQEHRFTLPQIKNCLEDLGLKFCGFENKDGISNFRELHGEEADIYDLALWHQYEESKPQAFVGMYQFWCQKPKK